jgi:hypothetical protein
MHLVTFISIQMDILTCMDAIFLAWKKTNPYPKIYRITLILFETNYLYPARYIINWRDRISMSTLYFTFKYIYIYIYIYIYNNNNNNFRMNFLLFWRERIGIDANLFNSLTFLSTSFERTTPSFSFFCSNRHWCQLYFLCLNHTI